MPKLLVEREIPGRDLRDDGRGGRSFDEVLEAHLKSRNDLESFNILIEDLAKFGFERVTYARKGDTSQHRLTDLDDAVVYSTYSKATISKYVKSGDFAHDTMVHAALVKPGAYSWRIAHDKYHRGDMHPDEAITFENTQLLGLTQGFAYSLPRTPNAAQPIYGLAFAAGGSQTDAERVWARHGDTIEMHLKMFDLAQDRFPSTKDDRGLSPRQREILGLLAEGKTSRDVAEILNIHRRTVEDHLTAARRALDAETTMHAIAKAVRDGTVW